MSAADDRQRLVVQHDVFKPIIMEMFQLALKDYGLLDKLEQAKEASNRGANAASKVAILDLGCGEGLFTYDFAGLLEQYNLRNSSEILGIDIDGAAINTSIEFCKNSKPARPYISFRTRDIALPFASEDPDSKVPSHRYDFIFILSVMVHLIDSRKHLQRIYQHLLKPGGVIYIADTVLALDDEDPVDGAVLPHPAMYPFCKELLGFTRRKNPGIEVATAQVQWLEEFGAERITSTKNRIVAGGNTLEGIAMLRNLIMAIRIGAPFLISHGLISEAFYDEVMVRLFKELSVYSEGYTTLVNVIATKPANS
jgi:SAM-dependent methyltransferase